MRGARKPEIEIKLRVEDLARLLRRLRECGALAEKRVFERNTLYDTPRGDLRRSGRLLRIRTETPAPPGRGLPRGEDPGGILTFKTPARGIRGDGLRSRYKVRDETELAFEDRRALHEILEGLGYLPGFRYEKFRTRYRLPGENHLHLDLDETPIGVFLELEGAPSAIRRAARQLGYSPEDHLTSTYGSLYAEFCRRKGQKPGHLVFS